MRARVEAEQIERDKKSATTCAGPSSMSRSCCDERYRSKDGSATADGNDLLTPPWHLWLMLSWLLSPLILDLTLSAVSAGSLILSLIFLSLSFSFSLSFSLLFIFLSFSLSLSVLFTFIPLYLSLCLSLSACLSLSLRLSHSQLSPLSLSPSARSPLFVSLDLSHPLSIYLFLLCLSLAASSRLIHPLLALARLL